MKRTLNLINIKKIENKEFDLDGQVFAFIGKNGSGKSSVIQAIETIFKGLGFMEKPVSAGKDVGSITYTGNDCHGEPIEIEWEVKGEDTTGKFKAKTIVDGKAKTITNVTRIRELMGNYIPISVQEAFSMMKSTDGRRRFMKDYIIPCLSTKDAERLNEIDTQISSAKNKTTAGNLFHTRTEKNNELKSVTIALEQSITKEEQKLLDKGENVREQLNSIKKKQE